MARPLPPLPPLNGPVISGGFFFAASLSYDQKMQEKINLSKILFSFKSNNVLYNVGSYRK